MSVLCTYCNEFSIDNEFCSKCGKKIKRDIGKWKISIDNKLSIQTTLKDEDIINCDNKYIEVPLYIDSSKAYFNYFKEITLLEYIKEKDINFKTIEIVINRVGEIIKSINRKKKILGTLDLDQLWIINEDIETLHLKQIRPYLTNGIEIKLYKGGRISSTEILYNHSKDINYSSDVYIVGRLLLDLSLKGKVIENRAHEIYLAYFISAFNDEIPVELHEWIYKTTTLFSEERYKNIEEALSVFREICKEKKHTVKDISFKYSSISDVGDYKRNKVKDMDESIRERANEDSHIVLEDTTNQKLFAMLADGISTTNYGSGYEAANIVKDISIEIWKEKSDNLQTLSDVKSFFLTIINNSNNKINNSIIKNSDEELWGTVMGATFVATIIIKNKMYITSLGDSKIYLFNNKKGFNLLNYEENYGTELLREGYTWGECNNIDGFKALTNCIGGNDINDEPKVINEEELNIKEITLEDKDVVLICSDGVTDYISPLGYGTNLWNIDKELKEHIVSKEKNKNILDIPSNLIKVANENGGGDNITSILIQANIN
ncbi:Serine/threonine phosphatase stp [uncultured Clostridium sp.]|uniref:PP2C family protein-serine/threonine phosphatase n=1 Tax=uncultured Clostridium sp. TaxID=59620 RepID=UPI0008223A4E|nr:PP2C family protein-serine/threonine phosphatase [uncultured Clostridium sp.]SCK04465.1 Serine/threonine phosphatase stp [uncultured Clostridium sp.]